MSVLTLSLLGPFAVTLDEQSLDTFPTVKVQALLAYLAIECDRAHRRESLMELLWPGMPLESAQVNLRQTLYRLRKTIPQVAGINGGTPVHLVLSDRQTVQINPDAAVHLDVNEFNTLLELDPAQAVKLYRGDFLADFYLVDSSEFESWAEGVRGELRRVALEALDQLTEEAIQAENHHQAQTYAWRQLEIDPLRESASRQLMRALANGGQRNAALAQYKVCLRRLLRELGLEPSPETTALYEQIQADALKATVVPPPVQVRPQGDIPVFLLTDIEDSTRLWDTHRQDMLPALLQHNAILEETITQHGGRILELRGDGVKAVFEGVNPLQCMIDIQHSLGAADWGEIGDLRIRIGLHGVPRVHKDFDYFIEDDHYYGPVLNHTARIMDAGHGGQILVSEQVHNAFSLPQGASWQDFGLHKVKSLDHPVQIYGLLHPDLPLQSFPPLRTERTQAQPKPQPERRPPIPHNLVPQLTPFIGRQEELAQLNSMLKDPDTRLITIVGPGGMGKTRLAIACAEIQIKVNLGGDGQFPDGVYFISLTDIDNPALIAAEIVKALNLPTNPGSMREREMATADQRLLIYLRRKKILLVLDNFEQLLDGAEILTEILQVAPDVHLVVTSRERLQLHAEQAFPIDGLNFPDWEAPEDPRGYAAMHLFLESAKRVQPDFELEQDDMVPLTRICRLLGGMPLGLELAASWVDLLSVKQIAKETQRGIDFLEVEFRDLPARHRSLRAICDSAWKRLGDNGQSFFAGLSVFRGGFNREAAQAVCGASIRTLAVLQSKSLIQYSPSNERYRMHPYLQRYAEEKLQASPAGESRTRDRHAGYYTALVETQTTAFESGTVEAAITRMDVDDANIKAAWEWAITQRNVLWIGQALQGLCHYFNVYSQKVEAIDLCQRVNHILLAKVSEPATGTRMKEEKNLIARVRARALTWQGFFGLYIDREHIPVGLHPSFISTQERDLASGIFNSSQQILDELKSQGEDVRAEEAQLHCYQALILRNYAEARRLLESSISLAGEVNDPFRLLDSLTWLGGRAIQNGNGEEAKSWLIQGLSAARLHKNQWYEVLFLVMLGWISRWSRHYETAIQYFEEAFVKAKAYGLYSMMKYSSRDLGNLMLFLGRLEAAKTKVHQALLFEEGTEIMTGTSARVTLGVIQWLAGEFDQAQGSMLTAMDTLKDYPYLATWYVYMSRIEFLLLTGQYEAAGEMIQRIDELARDDERRNYSFITRFTRICSWLPLVNGQYTHAKGFLLEAIATPVYGEEEITIWSQAFLALAERGLGNQDKGKEILKVTLSTAIEIQSYIPMVFILPMTLLFLADEDLTLASEIYQQVMRDPFLGKAQLFYDLVYRYLPDEITSVPVDTVETDPEHREALWAAARKVLAAWRST